MVTLPCGGRPGRRSQTGFCYHLAIFAFSALSASYLQAEEVELHHMGVEPQGWRKTRQGVGVQHLGTNHREDVLWWFELDVWSDQLMYHLSFLTWGGWNCSLVQEVPLWPTGHLEAV